MGTASRGPGRARAAAGGTPGSGGRGRSRSGWGRRAVQQVGFALAAPILLGLARLPLAVLYRLSDAGFVVVYRGLRYRRRVTRENLRRSFPRAAEDELVRIEERYYRYLCDLVVETLRMLVIDEAEIALRIRGRNLELLDGYAVQGRSVVLMLGHCGNWEWAIPCAELGTLLRLDIVYHQLTHPGFEALLRRARSRFGSILTPMQEAPRSMIRRRDEVTGMVFVADQFPRGPRPYRAQFLGQDTAFFRGPERIARRLDAPVIFVEVTRVARGRYELGLEVLCEHPAETSDGEITERFARRLEAQIQKSPEHWLWSHRRWKDASAGAAPGSSRSLTRDEVTEAGDDAEVPGADRS